MEKTLYLIKFWLFNTKPKGIICGDILKQHFLSVRWYFHGSNTAACKYTDKLLSGKQNTLEIIITFVISVMYYTVLHRAWLFLVKGKALVIFHIKHWIMFGVWGG